MKKNFEQQEILNGVILSNIDNQHFIPLDKVDDPIDHIVKCYGTRKLMGSNANLKYNGIFIHYEPMAHHALVSLQNEIDVIKYYTILRQHVKEAIVKLFGNVKGFKLTFIHDDGNFVKSIPDSAGVVFKFLLETNCFINDKQTEEQNVKT